MGVSLENKSKKGFAFLVHSFNRKICVFLSFVVLILMIVTTTGVIARYAFNHPLVWTWMSDRLLFGVFILFAGIYTMSENKHIRIEILYDHFSPKVKLVSKIITLMAFISFVGVLVWEGGCMGLNSLSMHEKAAGAFRIPLYPFKLLIPLAVFLFLIEGIIIYLKNHEV